MMREVATKIVRRLQAEGFAAYWVGGSVRDFLLGREPGDYDVVTSALPEQIEKLFKRTIAVGRKFGVMVVVEHEHQFEVATFRAEADYRDGRHPEHVRFGDAKADAERRDFTVNGLFYDPVKEELHDWVGGEKDLKARIIRTIGVPGERFAEDHLRMLRAVRLAVKLGFEIEPETFRAIQENAEKIKNISAERVRDELVKMFGGNFGNIQHPISFPLSPEASSPQPSPPFGEEREKELAAGSVTISGAARGLVLLRESGLLQHVLPEVAATVSCEQSPDFHPEGNVFDHLVLMLSMMPADASPLLPWAILMHDIAKPVTASKDEQTGSIHFYEHERIGAEMTETILERLRFPRKQIEAVATAVRYHMQFKDAPQMRKATLRRLLMRPTFPLELQLHRVDCLGSHGRLEVYDFLVEQAKELEKQPEIRPPLLTGGDLMKLGMKPGPEMGKLLNEIREKQLQDELKTAAEARKWAKQQLSTVHSSQSKVQGPKSKVVRVRSGKSRKA
jgi:tRNA nucleotidyltransferase/poly(A) polymerase